MSVPIDVTAAIISNGTDVLIAQRSEGQHLAGLWEFPGGKQENGETLQECLKREIKEELSIDIEVGLHCKTVEHEYDTKSIRLHAYHASVVGGAIELQSHKDAKWVPTENLSPYEFAPADIPIVKHLISHA